MALENTILQQTTGDDTDAVQVLISNYIPDIESPVVSPFAFNVPMYGGIGGTTLDFYSQNTSMISTNLNLLKTFTYVFTANTFSLSGNSTLMKHDIYRLPFNDFQNAISITASTSASTYLQTAVQDLSVPYITIYEPVSGNTFTGLTTAVTHNLSLPQIVKPVGGFSENLFSSKDQYFIDSTFVFSAPLMNITLGEVMALSGSPLVPTLLYQMPSGDTVLLQTNGIKNIITGNTSLSGTQVSGNFFVYFDIPNKPNVNVLGGLPSVQGQLSTYAPIFSWNNTQDGNSYVLSINYDINDINYTGNSISTFSIPQIPGDANFIRSFSTSLSPDVSFLWRLGNVYSLQNLFGLKNQVINYSSPPVSAITFSNGQFTLGGFCLFQIIGGVPVYPVTLTITTISDFSTINATSDSINDPNINSSINSPVGGGSGFTKQITNIASDGSFSFGTPLNGGVYSLVADATAAGFGIQTQTITLNANASIYLLFDFTWGSTSVRFIDSYKYQ